MVDWLQAYFAGEQIRYTDEIPLDLIGTAFQQQVWKELGRVPYGEVRTYGDIAAAIGRPSGSCSWGGERSESHSPSVTMSPHYRCQPQTDRVPRRLGVEAQTARLRSGLKA